MEASSPPVEVDATLTDAILMGILLRFLAPVLRTLTASYSSDTVHNLAVISFLLHFITCDYSYANGFSNAGGNTNTVNRSGNNKKPATASSSTSPAAHRQRPTFQGGTMSLTTAFFATTLLASRLQNNSSVYMFVSSSVVSFALYPQARYEVSLRCYRQRPSYSIVPLIITILLGVGTFMLLTYQEVIVTSVILGIICIVTPMWKCYVLERYKVLLRGPWDLPQVSSI